MCGISNMCGITKMFLCTCTEVVLMASIPNLWPTPMPYISCQCLLSMPGSASISGYLQKRSLSALLTRQLRFTVVFNGCIYYYKSSSSQRPQGAFSLKGYNRVQRSDDESASSAVFPFKIMSFSKEKRIWHFSTPNDCERKDSSSVYSALEKPLNIHFSQDSGLQLIGLGVYFCGKKKLLNFILICFQKQTFSHNEFCFFSPSRLIFKMLTLQPPLKGCCFW
uniref:PH domain-containing protein n=1 Tax=Eptatretus burgeri TaxID=7764 RepID=A0A8C4X1L4_EPTBU